MTTDTYPKVATRQVELGGATVTINGIAKGAGMIAPDMATMLSFVVTDAAIAAPVLQALLSQRRQGQLQRHHRRQRHLDLRHAAAVRHRRRPAPRIGECARPPPRAVPGGARRPPARPRAAGRARRRGRAQVRRGRGRGRRVGALGARGSRCRSPIRRWSRRRSPARTPIGAASSWRSARPASRADRDRLAIWFGDIRVAVKGERDPAYSEAAASAYMKRDEIVIRVDLGLGSGRRRSGPATSPRNTSRSTATTGAERWLCRGSARSRWPG